MMNFTQYGYIRAAPSKLKRIPRDQCLATLVLEWCNTSKFCPVTVSAFAEYHRRLRTASAVSSCSCLNALKIPRQPGTTRHGSAPSRVE